MTEREREKQNNRQKARWKGGVFMGRRGTDGCDVKFDKEGMIKQDRQGGVCIRRRGRDK
jgi:hypothetical protein